MLTLTDFSLLLVSTGNDMVRLRGVYDTIRNLYPENEVVIVYDNNTTASLQLQDVNLKEINVDHRVYVSSGYNIALQHATRKCFVFLHDDTFPAENFLENIIPNVTEQQFCNFTTVEPPLYGDSSTLHKPIKDFGRTMQVFDWRLFNEYVQSHINGLQEVTTDSPFGGFFMAGYVQSLRGVGGFDEKFKPYFYEDADLMLRLRMSGYTFVHAFNSIVYHMGSLTSRSSSESATSMQTTHNIFLLKWKCPWEYIRKYTLEHGMEYKKTSFTIKAVNCQPAIENYLGLISDDISDIEIVVDGNKLTQTDFEYLQTLPYLLSSLEDAGTYQVGNLTVHYNGN